MEKTNKQIERRVFITTQFPAFHRWENCPNPNSFLAHPHRHLFYVRMEFKVSHNDRDIEFIEMKEKIEKYIQENFYNTYLGNMSCEDIAFQLAQKFDAVLVEISEDGENGALIFYHD